MLETKRILTEIRHGLRPRLTILVMVAVMPAAPLAATTFAAEPALLSARDAAVISEAYHLWQTLGEEVWPGWTEARMPMVYVTDEREFAIGFAAVPEGFAETSQRIAERGVAARDRHLETTLAASYDFQGIPAVVIGKPANLELSPVQWSLKAAHEMFHVLSTQRGSGEKVRTLEIGPEDDASWQLDFPFPYEDVNVLRLLHLEGYSVFRAITAPDSMEPAVKYDAGTALEALEVMRWYLRETTGDDRTARYAMFQEGEEGAGRYTEYQLARLAADNDYEPLAEFRALVDYVPYADVWNEDYATSTFVIKHAGRAVKSRTAFYYVGFGKCLLLDRIDPNWKHAYFAPDVWLDDLIAAAVGSRTTLAAIEPGTPAPAFELTSLDGKAVRLGNLEGNVVLLEFWQWWCPPCIEAMPHLEALAEKYGERGLVVLGVSDRIDDAARSKMNAVMKKTGVSYPMLVDPTGAVPRDYGANSYPTLVLVDRDGTVRWVHSGYTMGEESVIEEKVVEVLEE
jgi:peroxiredoxin